MTLSIIKFFKELFYTKEKEINCRDCQFKSGGKDSWFCKKYVSVGKRYIHYKPICGNKKPRTKPKWCNL